MRKVCKSLWQNQNQPWGLPKSHLYIVQEGDAGPIKVGVAGHPLRRLSKLQAGNSRQLRLLAVYEGAPIQCARVEKAVLGYFSDRLLRGEWISASPSEARQVIAALSEGAA